MNSIEFVSEIAGYRLLDETRVINWLKFVTTDKKRSILSLKYIFVCEDRILEINNEYLKHNYKTDIITFDYSFLNKISGDIYICVPVVESNSKLYSKNNFEDELMRILLHGLLHLLGFNDVSDSEKRIMRKTENYYL
jgi:probable rRNA maturation factor